MSDIFRVILRGNDELGKLVLRLTLGFLMLFHGVAKTINPGSLEFIKGQLAELSLPAFISYGVFLGEIVAPLLIILGFFSRLGGLLVVGNMLFALVLVHSEEFLTLSETGGWALELQGLFLLSGFAIFLMGSGRFAVRPD